MNNSAFEGTVRSSTICQRTKKESRALEHQIIGRQLFWLWILQWLLTWLQLILAIIWESLEFTVLDNHPWMKRPLWKSRYTEENF